MRIRRRLLVVAGLFVVAGCGGDAAEPAKVPDLRHVRCLERAGLQFAAGPNELDFFAQDVQRDEADRPGVAFVENYSIAVRQWERSGAVDAPPSAPPAWMLLQAQPIGQNKTVYEIVRERPARSYVAYLREPTKRQLAGTDRCLTPTRAEIKRAEELSRRYREAKRKRAK